MVMGTGKTLQLGKEWLAFCGPMAMPTGRTQEQVGVKASPVGLSIVPQKVVERGNTSGEGSRSRFLGGPGERGAKKPRAATGRFGGVIL